MMIMPDDAQGSLQKSTYVRRRREQEAITKRSKTFVKCFQLFDNFLLSISFVENCEDNFYMLVKQILLERIFGLH